MEKGVKCVVEMEVKEINLEHCCMGGSTLVVVHSTEVVEEYMAKNGIEVKKTKKKV